MKKKQINGEKIQLCNISHIFKTISRAFFKLLHIRQSHTA